VTKSTTGYGYVLILDRGALSWKYVILSWSTMQA